MKENFPGDGSKVARRAGTPEPDKSGSRWAVRFWLGTGVLSALFLIALATPLPRANSAAATIITDIRGNVLATLAAENRQPVTLAEIPSFLRQAVIATEDAMFYEHGGVSLRGIVRAVWRNYNRGGYTQGASTITQQLARSIYLSQRRTIWRKLAEVFYALKLELHHGKDEILAGYLNQVYFGEGAYGVKTAARAYFARDPGELNLAEQTFLAGVLQSPARYSPWRHPEAASSRMEQVLQRMRACGYLDEAASAGVLAQPLRLRRPAAARQAAPYFIGHVQQFLASILPDGAAGIYRAGLQVQTTLDPDWQAAAEAAVAGLGARGGPDLQACLIALDPRTGAIRSMVGGRDFKVSQFNRATQAKRQPGSAFKPVVYAMALERGYTLSTMRDPRPRQFKLGEESYLPVDTSRSFTQPLLSLRQALAASCNVVAVAVGAELGPAAVAGFARRLGIESELRPYLSLPLGTSEVSPLELASVYAVFANGGRRVQPFAVISVRGADGRLLYKAQPHRAQVINPGTAFLLTQALADVFGPVGTAGGLNPGRPAAGKTGTSDGNRDAWFAGYTPDLVAVVQVGYDVGQRAVPGSGGSLAAPVWTQFVRSALRNKPVQTFTAPPGVHSLLICGDTGDLAGPGCPGRIEYFAIGTEPRVPCALHRLVEIVVCRRSGQLPGPHCRHRETRQFRQDEAPREICGLCREGVLDWLQDLFRRPRRRRFFPPNGPGSGTEERLRELFGE